MRKEPDIQPRHCKNCGEIYKPTGNAQMFCPDCRKVRIRKQKQEWYRKTNPEPRQKCREKCSVCGGVFSCHYNGKPYCNKHYQSMIKYGHPYGHPRKSTNTFRVVNGILNVVTKSGDVFLADAEEMENYRDIHGVCPKQDMQ